MGQALDSCVRKQHSHLKARSAWTSSRTRSWSLKSKETVVNAHGRSPQRVSYHLHPRIYMAAAGLLIWFVIAAWLLFGGSDYIELALAVISVLVLMAIAIPVALWRANVKAQQSNVSPQATEVSSLATQQASETLATWLRGQFATWTDQEKARRPQSRSYCRSRLWRLALPHWGWYSN